MTQENTGASADMGPSAPQAQRPWYRRPLWIGGALSALAVSFLAGGAFGQSVAPSGCWLGGGHFRHFAHHGGEFALADPEMAREHVQAGASWLLRAVDANDDQRARVNAVLGPLTNDLLEIVAQHRSGHAAFVQALAAPTVDKARLQEIRAGQMALFDKASERVVGALGDIAEVLTPEQRAKLIDLAHGPQF